MSKKIVSIIIPLILALLLLAAPVLADATVNVTPSGLPKTDATFVVTYNGDITGITVVTPDGRTLSGASDGEGLASVYLGDAPAGTYKLTLQGTFVTFGVTIVGTSGSTPTPTPATPTPTVSPTPTATPTPTVTPTPKPTPTIPGETTPDPTGTPTPKPTPGITATPTPGGSATPTPTEKPDPTKTPSTTNETGETDPTDSNMTAQDPTEISTTMQTPSGELSFETTAAYGWEEGVTPTPTPKTITKPIKIPGEVIFFALAGVFIILCIFIEYRYRPVRRLVRRIFGKKEMLSPEETRLKELYEQRLQAEEKLLKENKPQPEDPKKPKNKED